MKMSLFAACAVAAFYVVNPGQAFADQTGLAGMHAHAMIRGRRCFAEHTHTGSGTPERSKRAAIAAAAQNWSSFTAFEYGTDWARWKYATAKQVSCQSGAGSWTCEVQARPCLVGFRGAQQARRR